MKIKIHGYLYVKKKEPLDKHGNNYNKMRENLNYNIPANILS